MGGIPQEYGEFSSVLASERFQNQCSNMPYLFLWDGFGVVDHEK
jgi:hypothetical protein